MPASSASTDPLRTHNMGMALLTQRAGGGSRDASRHLSVAFNSACAIVWMLGATLVPAAAQEPPGALQPTPAASAMPLEPTPVPIASGRVPALDEFARAWDAIKAYSVTITVFEQHGDVVQNAVYDYTFRKPSSATLHVVSGSNAGATISWDGGDTVVAWRGSGFSAWFKKRIPLHDPQVSTIRGSSVDQLSYGAMLEYAQQASAVLSEAAAGTIDGVEAKAVTLIPSNSGNNMGLTREVIELSTATHLPVEVLGYVGESLVRKIVFSNVKLED